MKKIFTLLSFIFLISTSQAKEFITRWNLASPSTSSITFSIESTGPVAFTWETIPAGSNGSGTLNNASNSIGSLPLGSVIRLKIDTLNFRRFKIAPSLSTNNLVDVEQWGGVHWTSMDSAFALCYNLNISSTDIPDLSNVTSLSTMFLGCHNLNGPNNIGTWSTSNIQNMSSMFKDAYIFNQDIGNWNTGADTTMKNMFNNAKSFNQDIGNWNTSAVKNMRFMFGYDTVFNQNIGNWNTGSVEDMSYMFRNCKVFNQDIGNWNTANVHIMAGMFHEAIAFNQEIGNWNTSAVTNMNDMFYHAISFNKNIGAWNTSNVTDMGGMFYRAYTFNQSIANWNTGSVKTMSGMFSFAYTFNQDISNWNIASVESIGGMFESDSAFNQNIGNWNTSAVKHMSTAFANATSFNQNIGNWNTANVGDMNNMFQNATLFNQNLGNWQLNPNVILSNMLDNSGLDCPNYSNTLIGWSNNSITPSGRILWALNLQYDSLAIPNRNILINTKGWTINGDAPSSIHCLPTSVTDHQLNQSIKIFPNPCQHQANISIQSLFNQEAYITIFNSLGQTVYKEKKYVHQGENSFMIKSSQLSNGNYMVRIQFENDMISCRMVVSH